MVGGECVDVDSWPCTIDDLVSVGAQTSKSDGVGVVSCFNEKHDVDRQVATHLEQVIKLVRQ